MADEYICMMGRCAFTFVIDGSDVRFMCYVIGITID